MEPKAGHAPAASYSPAYLSLLRAGTRIGPLTQAHARLVVSGLHRSTSLLTKLLSSVVSSSYSNSLPYALFLLSTVPSPDPFLFDSLIRSASRSRSPLPSLLFYLRMRSLLLPPSSFTFTSSLKSCADLSALNPGRNLHSHAVLHGFDSDPHVQTALLVLYSKCARLGTARTVFDRIPQRGVVAWNAMISGYEQNGHADEAILVFRAMLEDGRIAPDSATMVGLLSACSQSGALDLGRWAEGYIVEKRFRVDVVLGTSLVNMYARCGDVKKAREVFEGLPERNVVAWTAMIAGYGMHGHGESAVELFRRMRSCGPTPNDVTFVAVLSACAHAGLVAEGREAFECMRCDYGFLARVEHHVCMVDMFGRAGLLKEAMQFITEWIHGEPGPAVWTAMVGACKMHKDFELGAEVAERLLAVEPENPGHYVLLSNIYALAGKMDRVEKVRNAMIRRRLKKQTGYSSIEISRVAHVFRMGDTSHPQTSEIYRYLELLISKIREAGYMPETDSMLHELEEEEREVALRFHSEKLAVAFGIMSTVEGTMIRIVKNLRICGDCHLAIKFISIVANREIIVRDKHRFHHFKDGSCSCQDFW